MGMRVRLKTGFFEKTTCRLEAGDDRLMFVPAGEEGADSIVLEKKDIFSVTLTERRLPELEIQTQDALIEAVFEENVSFEDALDYLKDHLNVNITCEYKGGEKHA